MVRLRMATRPAAQTTPGAELISYFTSDTDILNPDSSANVQTGIHRCIRARQQKQLARRLADPERRRILL